MGYTLFAPINSAFTPGGTGLSTNVLTLASQTLAVKTVTPNIVVSGGAGQGADFQTTDVYTKNAVVHTIRSVLITEEELGVVNAALAADTPSLGASLNPTTHATLLALVGAAGNDVTNILE